MRSPPLPLPLVHGRHRAHHRERVGFRRGARRLWRFQGCTEVLPSVGPETEKEERVETTGLSPKREEVSQDDLVQRIID